MRGEEEVDDSLEGLDQSVPVTELQQADKTLTRHSPIAKGL